MGDLSPAAQAVLDASLLMDSALSRSMVAAALRAAAEALPEIDIPFAIVDEWERIEGVCASFNAAVEWGHKQALAQLLAIATELEGNV